MNSMMIILTMIYRPSTIVIEISNITLIEIHPKIIAILAILFITINPLPKVVMFKIKKMVSTVKVFSKLKRKDK